MIRTHLFYGQNISKLIFETKVKLLFNWENSIPEIQEFKMLYIYILYILCIALCKFKVGFVKFSKLFHVKNFRSKQQRYEIDRENKFCQAISYSVQRMFIDKILKCTQNFS